MRRLYIVIAAAAGLYLDSVFFARVNISGIRPDAIMALTASLGVLLGMKKGALFGLIMGLIADVLYSPMVGLSAMGYMFAGLLGGAFYQKYYADNIIIPALVAAVGAIFKYWPRPVPPAGLSSAFLPCSERISCHVRC
mgnify:CR=1 FL=1